MAIAPGAAQNHGQVQTPREKPDELAEPEDVPGLAVVVVGVAQPEEAEEVLVDEVEVEESVDVAGGGDVADGIAVIGIAEAGEDVPRRGDGEEEQQSGEEMELTPAAPFAGEDEIRNDGGDKEDGCDESFGEKSERERGIGEVKARRFAVLHAGEEAVKGKEKEEGEDRFRNEGSREEKHAD